MPQPNSPLTRAAPLRADSWNAETWSFDIVMSTGAAVERHDARGTFSEVLNTAGATWPDTIPLLDSHRRSSLDDQIGEVSNIRLEGGAVVGTAKLSRHSPRAQRLAAELTDGQRYGGSIGYAVPDAAWAETKSGAKRTKTATAFSILELSLVSIPADPSSTIRSLELTTPNTETTVIDRSAVNAEIRTMATAAGLDQVFIDAQIDANATAEQAARAALAEMATRNTPANNVRNTPAAVITADHTDPDKIRSAMAGAIAHRLSPRHIKLEGRAADFAGYRVLDMVGDLCNARGDRVNVRDQNALIERAVGAHSTSDFSLLLAEAANASLVANYAAAEPTYRLWAAQRSFNDFRPHNFLRIGDFPEFKEVGEGSEVQYGTLSENREQVSAKEYNSGIALGRRLLLSDDLSALSDFSQMIAQRSAADENRLVYSMLTSTATLSDGVVIFHASHGNKAGTGTAITSASVGAAFTAMRKQKSKDGLVLNLKPKWLLVGPDKEAEALQFLAVVNPTKASDVSPYAGRLELIVDAEIEGNAWYVLADPASAPSIVYGYVAGANGPVIRSETDFDTRAVKIAAGLDFGYGAIDFRGAYSNAGA